MYMEVWAVVTCQIFTDMIYIYDTTIVMPKHFSTNKAENDILVISVCVSCYVNPAESSRHCTLIVVWSTHMATTCSRVYRRSFVFKRIFCASIANVFTLCFCSSNCCNKDIPICKENQTKLFFYNLLLTWRLFVKWCHDLIYWYS